MDLRLDEAIGQLVQNRRETVDRLRRVLVESLDLRAEPDEIDADTPLFAVGMGLDSIDALQLILGVEKEFCVTIPPDDLMIFRSINSIADFLLKCPLTIARV